jgi:Protein of unknown function (DUF3455)
MQNFPRNAAYSCALKASSIFLLLIVSFVASLTNAQTQSPSQNEPPPDVPDAIQAPAGLQVAVYAHATGSQVYTCQASSDGKFAWTLKAPDAELHDRKDKIIGHHSAGPSWKLADGSEVTGKAAAHVDSLDPDSIPWLLVNVVSHSGKGALSDVTTIQRVRTHGGKAPSDGCDAAHANAETKTSYAADYYFYAPAK